MREIKFRAWNKKLKCWGGNISINLHGVKAPALRYGDVMTRGDSYELMQYTGLKDKNGKEIYEGDIVNDDARTLTKILVVYWSEKLAAYMVEPPDKTWNEFLGDVPAVRLEVIGNVMENPELLNG